MNRLFDPLLVTSSGVLLAGLLAFAQADHGPSCGQGGASCPPTCGKGCGHGGSCCDRCGCRCKVQKVCRLVCEEKEIKVDCFGCKCVDFCIPQPSDKCSTHCDCVCRDCDAPAKDSCCWERVLSVPKKFIYNIWKPCGACVHTKKVLMHRVETKKIPVYRWKVEHLCPSCESCSRGAELPADPESIPLPPDPHANLKFQPFTGTSAASHAE